MIAETISARNDWRVKKKIALSPQTALWSISMESPKSYHLPPWRQGCIAKKHLDLERQIIEPDTLHSILRWARIASKHVNVNNGKNTSVNANSNLWGERYERNISAFALANLSGSEIFFISLCQFWSATEARIPLCRHGIDSEQKTTSRGANLAWTISLRNCITR